MLISYNTDKERSGKVITKLCHVIADFFIKENIIDEDQREIYNTNNQLFYR